MSTTPHVVLGVMVRNKVKREFLNLAQAWTAGVNASGFHACIHENFITGGQHKVTMVSMDLKWFIDILHIETVVSRKGLIM